MKIKNFFHTSILFFVLFGLLLVSLDSVAMLHSDDDDNNEAVVLSKTSDEILVFKGDAAEHIVLAALSLQALVDELFATTHSVPENTKNISDYFTDMTQVRLDALAQNQLKSCCEIHVRLVSENRREELKKAYRHLFGWLRMIEKVPELVKPAKSYRKPQASSVEKQDVLQMYQEIYNILSPVFEACIKATKKRHMFDVRCRIIMDTLTLGPGNENEGFNELERKMAWANLRSLNGLLEAVHSEGIKYDIDLSKEQRDKISVLLDGIKVVLS